MHCRSTSPAQANRERHGRQRSINFPAWRGIRQRGKETSVRLNFGALYAVVESLEREELIKATGTEQDGNRPTRTVYDITEAGVDELRDWLRAWVGDPEKEYPRFLAALSFLPVLPPEEAVELLRRRITLLDKRIVDA
ncbi:PadR family transcriptional regulator [Nocardia arthritidis]|nr:PadR family transcriptional regulator [Nocardia arthritidis]